MRRKYNTNLTGWFNYFKKIPEILIHRLRWLSCISGRNGLSSHAHFLFFGIVVAIKLLFLKREHLTIFFNYFCPLSKGNGALVYRDPAGKLLFDGKTI